MKKVLLLLLIIGATFFTSCEIIRGPRPVGKWQTTHQYLKRTVDGSEAAKALREVEISADVPEAESYRLTFKRNGTGSGSWYAPDESGRYYFGFTWEKSDNSIFMRYAGETVILRTDDISAESLSWKVEESSARKLVLSIEWNSLVDGDSGGWSEHCLLRYTFSKAR
jgi:hypothetical protein